jgi:hypothetical protein
MVTPAERDATGQTAREAKERLLAIRIPQRLLESIDGHVDLMRVEIPWVHMTRSDVVRWMLAASIERYRNDREALKRELNAPRIAEAS